MDADALRDRERVYAPIDKSKLFKDSIHGDIILHPLLVAIIDTPQFQRLRHIGQLGVLQFVYPGGVNNRFQHCIGTAHLAGFFVRKLFENDPMLLIDKRDVLCVQIAGLLHDLGHGPFSHLFDARFLPRALPNRKIHHEDLSIRMFDHLYESNAHVQEAFKEHGLLDIDRTFIKELIFPQSSSGADWPHKGRGAEKAYLYEIVSNKRTGIDVDKFDYLARDALHLGINCTFDHLRYMTFCKVVPDEFGVPCIVARDKEAFNLYELYQQRYRLHVTAYQHKTALVIQEMFVEALLKANDHLLIPSRNKDEHGKVKLLKMSECIDDMSAYELLTDEVCAAIRMSYDPKLQEAKSILENIYSRRIFACIGKTRLNSRDQIAYNDCAAIRSEVVKHFSAAVFELKDELQEAAIVNKTQPEQLAASLQNVDEVKPFAESDIVICMALMNHGINKEKNPLDAMRFYSKYNPTASFKMRRENIAASLPMSFSERLLYAYAKRGGEFERDLAARCFRLWCKSSPNKYEVDEARDGYVQSFTTPVKDLGSANDSLIPSGSSAKKQKLRF